MASVRKAKKQAKKMGVVYKSPSSERKKLMSDTREMVDKVNKRLRNLERGGYYNSYASKKLFNRLDTNTLKALEKTRSGKIQRVKVSKELTNTQLIALQKASKQFLVSKTSTTRRIKEVSETTKESMYKTLKISREKEVTKEDIEDYYEMLGDNDFEYFSDKIGASEMWVIIDRAREENDSANDFIRRLEKYAFTINDEDIKLRALRLYEKFVI